MTVKQPATRIVCFGDSLVEGADDTGKQNGFMGRMMQALPANQGLYAPGTIMFNLGISGDTVRDLWLRFGEVVVRKPDILLLGTCANDVRVYGASTTPSGTDEYKISPKISQDTWRDLLALAKKICTRVLVVGPCDHDRDGVWSAQAVYGAKEHLAFMQKLCQQLDVEFFDQAALLNPYVDSYGKFPHPSAAGYERLAHGLLQRLRQLEWVPA